MSLRNLVAKIHHYLKGFWARARRACFRQKYLKRRMEEKYGLTVSMATIERAIAELKAKIGLRTVPHGRKGCEYLPPVLEPTFVQLELFEGDFEGDSASGHITEVLSEVSGVTETPLAPPNIPSQAATPRPIPQRVWNAVNRAWARIRKARNPEAYKQALINSELRLAWREEQAQKLRDVQPPPPEPIPQHFERIVGQAWTWPANELDEHGIPRNWKSWQDERVEEPIALGFARPVLKSL